MTIANILARHQPAYLPMLENDPVNVMPCAGCGFLARADPFASTPDARNSGMRALFADHQAEMIQPALATIKAAAEQWSGHVEFMADTAAETDPENADSFRTEAREVREALEYL